MFRKSHPKKIDPRDLPESFSVPDPYGLLENNLHVQNGQNNCTSHSFALMTEFNLSDRLKERTLIDVDDLWEKQKSLGTATEELGDFTEGPFNIARDYGVRFRADSGRTGSYFLSGKKHEENGIMVYEGGFVIMDDWLIVKMIRFFKKKKDRVKKEFPKNVDAEQEYKKDISRLFKETRRTLNDGAQFGAFLEIKKDGIGSEIFKSIEDVSDLKITFTDKGKENVEIAAINERHQDFLNSRRPLGGVGGPSFYWGTWEALHPVIISAQFLWPWVVRHVAQDMDDGAWNAVKNIVKKIIKSVLSKKENPSKEDIVLRMFEPVSMQHGLAFVFPGDLAEDQIDKAFSTIQDAASNLPLTESGVRSARILKYSPTREIWEESPN